jgi:ATP-binding cassette subfamily F protein uup
MSQPITWIWIRSTWLEGLFEKSTRGSVILITHDRAFLDNVCTQISQSLIVACCEPTQESSLNMEVLKEQELNAESLANARARYASAPEEFVRIGEGRRGIRRTRSVARIARLEKLRASRAERRDAMGQVKLAVSAGERSGEIVAELQNAQQVLRSTNRERLYGYDMRRR